LCQLKNKCPGFKVVGLTLKMIASPYSVVNILVWVHRTNNLNILTHKKGGSICQKKKGGSKSLAKGTMVEGWKKRNRRMY
jgi:hypothetical protein